MDISAIMIDIVLVEEANIFIHFFMAKYDTTTLLWPCLNAITLTSPHLLYYVSVVIIRKKDIVCHNVLLLLSAFFSILTPKYMISHINVCYQLLTITTVSCGTISLLIYGKTPYDIFKHLPRFLSVLNQLNVHYPQ